MTALGGLWPRAERGRRSRAFALLVGLAMLAALLPGCGGAGVLGAGLRYDRPGLLARLPDGRRINLRCTGRGSPTVILDAGFGADSEAWTKVQPQVARATRVCAYDRAGYGFSDPGPLPRDGAAIARDLDQALKAARIAGPFVVVGHSAGALYGRIFAARRLRDTVGLVLLDPTVERRALTPGSGDGLDPIRERVRRCLTAAESRSAGVAGCLPTNPASRLAAIAARPAYWRTELSELDAIFGRTSEEANRTVPVLRNVPIYILTASETVAGSAFEVQGQTRYLWLAEHQALAGVFLHASRRTIRSSHLIMIQRPEVATAAILDMVRAARAGRAPPPLPADEPFP